MLAGRESLRRLIGKRRRALQTDLDLLLLQSQVPSPIGSIVGENNTSLAASSSAGDSGKSCDWDGSYDAEWVTCPVCSDSIRGTDFVVNTHLDTCLARQKKQKLTQSTLLQFNFYPKSSSITTVNDLNNSNCVKKRAYNQSNDHVLAEYSSICQGNDFAVDSHDIVQCPIRSCDDASVETVPTQGASCKVFDLPSSDIHCQGMKIHQLAANEHENAEVVVTLDTYIVGRRFHQEVELQQGARVSLLRDPENTKDIHAIKVLNEDSRVEQMAGYLPRELARHLSPLIDKYQIKCQGSVTSLPKHPLDSVPIQLVCSKNRVQGIESSDRQAFELLWQSITRMVDHAKTLSMTKYQQNFCVLLQDVLFQHAQLFTDEEKFFLGSFQSLSDNAQRLFIRLYSRKGPWFRMANLSYPEISDYNRAVQELKLMGYIDSFYPCMGLSKPAMKELLDVLTVIEMREMSKELSKKGISSARRDELLGYLCSAYENGSCPLLPERVSERVGTCVKVSSTAEVLMWRVQRLFFLNGEQDLSAFLLVDLGVVRFPDYICYVSHPIFPDRSCLLAYEEAMGVAQIMDQSLDENNMEKVLKCIYISESRIPSLVKDDTQLSVADSPPMFFSYFSASWVYSKVLFLGVSVFERERRYEDAVRLLRRLLSRFTRDSRRGCWTLRLSVDLEHLGRVDESLSVAEEGVLDPWVRAGSKVALQRRIVRLGKPPRRWKLPSFAESVKRKIKEVTISGRPLNCETGAKNIFYGYDGDLCGVEQLALQYYAGEGGNWQGVHAESGIWMTIFGLLMWDVIFCDVPNVFCSKFQMAPLDLDTDDFYVARESLIEYHLQKIQEGMAEEILITSWESHLGTLCRGVNWDRHSLSELRAVVACIGRHCLVSFCRHLALDYRSWSSGMPDLLLWHFYGDDRLEGEAKLVEVKGPRDRLSEQQRAWLLLLTDCGFDVEICKLSCHLALDYRSWSSGMPDLLLWRLYGDDRLEGEAKLVEVKGPQDRLSEQQRAWFLLLMDCGFDAKVCKVSAVAIS